MDRIIAMIDKALNSICMFFMGLIFLIVIVEVFQRYIFGTGAIWAEEVVSMLFVATTLFGTVIGVREKEHIAVPFIFEKMPLKMQNICNILSSFIIVITQIIMIVVSIKWIGNVGNVLSPAIRIPLQYFYWMLPVSAGLLILYEFYNAKGFIDEAIKSFKGAKQGSDVDQGGL